MLKAMFAWVEVGVLRLLLCLELLKNLALLLLSELFSVNACVLSCHGCETLGILLLFDSPLLYRGLLLNLGRLNIVLRSLEVDLDIGLHAADLIIWASFDDVNSVVATSILNVNRVTFVKD